MGIGLKVSLIVLFFIGVNGHLPRRRDVFNRKFSQYQKEQLEKLPDIGLDGIRKSHKNISGFSYNKNEEFSHEKLVKFSRSRTLGHEAIDELKSLRTEEKPHAMPAVLPNNLIVDLYNITLQPYFLAPGITFNSSRTYTTDGYVRIRFNMTQGAHNVSIHIGSYITLLSYNLYADGVRQSLISTQYFNATNLFVITPTVFLNLGVVYELEFTYTGMMFNDAAVFVTRWTDSSNQAFAHYLVGTFLEPSFARSVFPCFDEPAFKANFSLTLIFPTSLVALANTRPISNTSLANGWSQTTFETTPRMSTYLLAFVIGEFVGIKSTANDGTEIGVWTFNGDYGTNSTDWLNRFTVALNTSVMCYNALSSYFGFPFPLKKLDHIAVPFYYVNYFGAMENWGLIIYDYNYVVVHNQEDTTYEKFLGIQVRCHEIMHQWLGNIVTNSWWSEIMLHESLADYFETLAIELMYPNQANFSDAYYVYQSQEYAFRVDTGYYNDTLTGGQIHPVVLYPDGTFDNIVYAKGGSLIRMIAQLMGRSQFQEAIQTYLRQYQFSNADHFQFFQIFTAIAQKYAKTDWCGGSLDVNRLMDSWVNVPHFPSITVDLANDGRSYVTGQETFLPVSYLPTGYNYSWFVPTRVFQNGNAPTWVWIAPNTTQCANVFEKSAVSTYDKYDIFNEGAPSFARIRYEEGAHNKILQFVQNNNATLHTSTKTRLIGDEWGYIDRDMVNLGLPPRIYRGMQILEAVLNSSSSVSAATFRVAQSVLDSVIELSRDRHEYELYLRFLTPILTNFYNNVGWSGNEDDYSISLLRQRFLHYAIQFDIGDSRQRAGQIWASRASQPVNPDIRRAVYCGAIWNDDGTVFNDLWSLVTQAEATGYYTVRELSSLLQGIACAQNRTLISTILTSFVRLSTNTTKYSLYTAFSYFSYNRAASEEMANYIVTYPERVVDGMYCVFLGPSECTKWIYLDGMTRLWYTNRRVQLYDEIFAFLYPGTDAYDDAVLRYYYSILLSRNLRGKITYSDMTRFMYDRYVPRGFTPWTKRLNETFVPSQYDVLIRAYFPGSYSFQVGRNFTYDGNVTIQAVKSGDGNTISFNTHRQIIEHIQIFVENGTVLNNLVSVNRDYENAIITVTVNQTILNGTSFLIAVNYSGFIYQNPQSGTFINWDYVEWNKQKSWIFATSFEGGPGTRSLVPCYDEPHYKAKWVVTVQYPADFVALSNSLEEKVTQLGNGLAQTIFKPTPPMSSYLLAISVGDYAAVRGLTNTGLLVRVWTWNGMQNDGAVGLRALIDTINYLTSIIFIRLPLEKVDMLALPQYTGYSSGAMENWGLIINGYLTALYNPDYSTTNDYINTYWVSSHETVHHWFGDLVTMDWWNYIFLNEGFATYWPTTIMNASYANQTEWFHFYRFNDAERAFRFDESGSVPIVPSPSRLGPGFDIFGTQSYRKAAYILHQIEQTIGRQNFELGVHIYIATHQFNTTIDTDLFDSLTLMAQDSNLTDWNGYPLNITTYIGPNFYLDSYPIIKVVSTGDGLGYNYQQNPLAIQTLSTNSTYLWNIPIWTEPAGPRGGHRWLNFQSTLNRELREWHVVNARRRAYARVWYDDLAWAPIQNQIQTNLTYFDEITRAALISDNYLLASQQWVPWSRLFTLIKYATTVPEIATWTVVNNIFNDWISKFKFQNDSYILNAVNSNAQLLFSHNGNWANDITSTYITSLSCYLNSPQCLTQASTNFNQFVTACQNSAYGTGRCNQLHPDHRTVQFCYGLKQNSNAAPAILSLIQWYANTAPFTDYWRQDAVALLNSLACLNNDTTISSYLRMALSNQIPVEIFQNVANNDPSGMRLYNFFQNNLVDVINSPTFNPLVSNIAHSWSTDGQLNLLQNFDWQGNTLTTDQTNTWNNAINGVISTRNWLAQNKPAFLDWLNANV